MAKNPGLKHDNFKCYNKNNSCEILYKEYLSYIRIWSIGNLQIVTHFVCVGVVFFSIVLCFVRLHVQFV